MGNNIGNSVNSGITLNDFKAALNAKGINAEKQAEAIKIFNFYASQNTAEGADNNVLDEQEQVMARSAFAQWDNNENGNVGKKEYNKSDRSNTGFADVKYNAAEAYMEAMQHAAQTGDNSHPVGEHIILQDNNGTINGATVIYGAGTTETTDDIMNSYSIGQDGSATPVENFVAEEVKPPVPPTTVTKPNLTPAIFNNEAEVKNAVISHLLGSEFSGLIANGKELQVQGLNIEYNNETKQATVKFNDVAYTVQKDADGNIVIQNDDAKQSLQQAVLESESTDDAKTYHHRGRMGNDNSTYDAETGTINHGKNKNYVAQTQTFASMLMNNNENATLTIDGQLESDGTRRALSGEEVINTMDAGGDNKDKKLSLQELISYLQASHTESDGVVKAGQNNGSRVYAGSVDIDIKDLANIGKVFAKYAGDDKLMDASELDQLITDLKTKGKTMTSLAGQEGTAYVTHTTTEVPVETTPEETVLEHGREVTANRTRKIDTDPSDGNRNGVKGNYHYESGVRSAVVQEGDKTYVDNKGNIAVMDATGKNEFIYIQGLQAEVDARVQHNAKVDGNAPNNGGVIEVEDKNGNTTFYAYNNDNDNKTYTLGEQLVKRGKKDFVTAKQLKADGLKAVGITNDSNIPKDLKMEYDNNGKIVFKYKGANVSTNVAKVIIMKYNTQTDS